MSELLKPRTIIAFMLYGTFCALSVQGKIGPEAVITVVTALMTFFYAERKLNNGKVS